MVMALHWVCHLDMIVIVIHCPSGRPISPHIISYHIIHAAVVAGHPGPFGLVVGECQWGRTTVGLEVDCFFWVNAAWDREAEAAHLPCTTVKTRELEKEKE
jgi:hypothetical protein